MVTQMQQGRFTYADYLLTPDDVRYELIDGALIMAPAPIPRRCLRRLRPQLPPAQSPPRKG